MKQRIIVVPKDKMAVNALDYNEATKDQLIELYLNENEFLGLCKEGFFDLINSRGKAIIDDYEDESIINIEILKNVLEVIKEKVSARNEENDLINKIKVLFQEAVNRETGVYFFF